MQRVYPETWRDVRDRNLTNLRDKDEKDEPTQRLFFLIISKDIRNATKYTVPAVYLGF